MLAVKNLKLKCRVPASWCVQRQRQRHGCRKLGHNARLQVPCFRGSVVHIAPLRIKAGSIPVIRCASLFGVFLIPSFERRNPTGLYCGQRRGARCFRPHTFHSRADGSTPAAAPADIFWSTSRAWKDHVELINVAAHAWVVGTATFEWTFIQLVAAFKMGCRCDCSATGKVFMGILWVLFIGTAAAVSVSLYQTHNHHVLMSPLFN